MSAILTESIGENAALAWLASLGYKVLYGSCSVTRGFFTY